MINKLLIKSIINNIKNNTKLYNSYNFTYSTQIYSLPVIIEKIILFIKVSSPWRLFDNFCTDIKWQSLYYHFNKLQHHDIFKMTYTDLLKKYLRKKTNKKLSLIYTDTSVINNKYNSDTVKRNKYYKNKKVAKLSIITDYNGIPIGVKMYSGNQNDGKILCDQFKNDNLLIDLKSINNSYFLADKGYDFLKQRVREMLIKNNLKPIIAFNKRNTKDINKIKKLNEIENKIYKKRIYVENMFSKIKNYRRLNVLYERNINSYTNLLYLAFYDIILKIK